MADLLVVGVVVAFFAVAALLVRACEAIIGPEPQAPVATRPVQPPAAQAASR